MAKREYSNGLQHLKFMQRAQQREEALKKAEQEAATIDESHWVLPASSGKRCVVVMEGDPKPGALVGRMSFQNCNSAIEKLVEEVEVTNRRRFMAAKERVEGPSATTGLLVKEARSRDDDERGNDDEQDVQNKKPKVGAPEKPPARAGEGKRHDQIRNDKQPWQGWRTGADYRLLRPPGKR